jgi:hypothetical protein
VTRNRAFREVFHKSADHNSKRGESPLHWDRG